MSKQIVREEIRQIDDVCVDNLGGSIDKAIRRIKKWEKKAKELGYTNIGIEVQYSYDYIGIELVGDRLETDQEYEARQKKEAKAKEAERKKKAKKEEKEKRELKRLVKKYGAPE